MQKESRKDCFEVSNFENEIKLLYCDYNKDETVEKLPLLWRFFKEYEGLIFKASNSAKLPSWQDLSACVEKIKGPLSQIVFSAYPTYILAELISTIKSHADTEHNIEKKKQAEAEHKKQRKAEKKKAKKARQKDNKAKARKEEAEAAEARKKEAESAEAMQKKDQEIIQCFVEKDITKVQKSIDFICDIQQNSSKCSLLNIVTKILSVKDIVQSPLEYFTEPISQNSLTEEELYKKITDFLDKQLTNLPGTCAWDLLYQLCCCVEYKACHDKCSAIAKMDAAKLKEMTENSRKIIF